MGGALPEQADVSLIANPVAKLPSVTDGLKKVFCVLFLGKDVVVQKEGWSRADLSVHVLPSITLPSQVSLKPWEGKSS